MLSANGRLGAMALLILCIVGPLLLLLSESRETTQQAFNFPSNKLLVADVCGTLRYMEGEFGADSSETTLLFRGLVHGHPRGNNYRMEWRSFGVTNDQGGLLLQYNVHDNGVRYTSTDENREEIFQAFAIDLEDTDAINDRSLLRESFTIGLSKNGGITKINLPLRLERAIRTAVKNRKGATWLYQLLDRPNELPLLLGDGGSAWRTKGSFLGPLALNHHAVAHAGKITEIVSAGISGEPSPIEDVRLTWRWDPNSGDLFSVALTADLLESRQLLGRSATAAAHVDLKATLSFE